MPHLVRDDRPLRPALSTLYERFSHSPYYRFYYAAVASDVSGSRRTRRGLWILISLLVDLGDLFSRPG
jgi:hypothetical protein